MELFVTISTLVLGLMLLLSSQVFEDVATTLVHKQCGDWLTQKSSLALSRPKLKHVDDLVLTKYFRMDALRLKNQGGTQLLYCDGFNFPEGINVKLTVDGRSCEISGTPLQAQASALAYVVATNQSGRSLATVQIMVNALVLQE